MFALPQALIRRLGTGTSTVLSLGSIIDGASGLSDWRQSGFRLLDRHAQSNGLLVPGEAGLAIVCEAMTAVAANATVHRALLWQIGPGLASKSGYKSKAWW